MKIRLWKSVLKNAMSVINKKSYCFGLNLYGGILLQNLYVCRNAIFSMWLISLHNHSLLIVIKKISSFFFIVITCAELVWVALHLYVYIPVLNWKNNLFSKSLTVIDKKEVIQNILT